MGVIELGRYVAKTTSTFRKGEEVTTEQVGPVQVTTVDAMPPVTQAPPGTVDVHFMLVAFTEGIDQRRFLDLVKDACDGHGEFSDVSRTRLLRGPSYIELGGWLGSQDIALRFLALGERLDLWEVITPERMRITGAQADEMAENGFVMLAPKPKLKDELTVP